MVILGIDPGLNTTGYGVLEMDGETLRMITAGDIRAPKRDAMSVRLSYLHDAVDKLMIRYQPTTLVLEAVFTHNTYVSTAALMAHARGVICQVGQQHKLTLVEYSPARVKKAITGHGNASKDQVAKMVEQWLGTIELKLSEDATDALALAIGFAHMEGKQFSSGASP